MSTVKTLQIASTSSKDTELLGEQLGRRLRGSEVIELVSDLGGGKTTLTRGIAKGIGSKNVVASPTFTVNKVYTGPKLTIYHFDFYRLDDPGLVKLELEETFHDEKAVAIIEWADAVANVLPDSKITIKLAPSAEDGRNITATAPAELAYVLEGIDVNSDN